MYKHLFNISFHIYGIHYSYCSIPLTVLGDFQRAEVFLVGTMILQRKTCEGGGKGYRL